MATAVPGHPKLTKVRVEKLRQARVYVYQYPAGKMVRELLEQGYLKNHGSSGYYRTTKMGSEAVRAFDAASTSSTP